MYPSYINGNTTPIFYNLDQTIPYNPTLYEINPYSKQEDPPSSSLFHFPSPYIHYEDNIVLLQHLHDLLLQQQPLTAEGSPPEAMSNMADSIKNDVDGRQEDFNKQCHSGIEQIPRKRSSKKDRHSKINTAQGLRDRRMRLSLKVAEEFFDLQDMLGFDKASKTVEWLLNKSKSAIQDLTGDHLPHTKRSCATVHANSASSTSECEVVSGNYELVNGNRPVRTTVAKEKKIRAFRKSAFHPLSKESREKAREKARERTREKRKLRESKLPLEALNHDMSRLGSWSPFEIGEESGTQNQNLNPPIEVLEELSSSIIFNNMAGISQEYQFTDFQAYGKPREAYSNINLC